MRLIDRDELKKAMDGYWGTCQRIRKPRNGETAVFLDVMATVDKQPTVDAVPVKHGKWIHEIRYTIDSLHSYQQYRCSECGMTYITNTNYCPECGARMDVRKE